MTARVPVTTRISEAGLHKLLAIGERLGDAHPDRSEIHRALLSEALLDPNVVNRAVIRLRREKGQL